MRFKRTPLFYRGVLLFWLLLTAITSVEASEEQSLRALAAQPQWLRLLHYENNKSTFVSPSFFLAPTGKTDPHAELLATVALGRDVTIKKNNDHPRCRFPARYLWLGQQLNIRSFEKIPGWCHKLGQWLTENRIDHIEVMLVSGYMGNPASLFGHTLIKLPTQTKQDLFSSTINYGAKVPRNENIFRYIAKGIFGGYNAEYSDSYFYNADLMYGHHEQRDSWSYTLKLSPFQRKLLQYHLWEILHKQKKYYFLTKNCGYEIGNAIRAAAPEISLNNNGLWYLPQQLPEDIAAKGYIGQITYHPSAEKILLAHYETLSPQNRAFADAFIEADFTEQKRLLEKGSINRSLLNFLLAYQYYKYEKERPNVSEETLYLKRKLLALRFQLPPESAPLRIKIPSRPDPTVTQKSSRISLDISDRNRRISIAPFSMDENGWNALNGDRLILLNLSFTTSNRTPVSTRYQLDLIDIAHYAHTRLPTSSPWSWKIHLGAIKDNDGFYGQLNGSIGRSFQYQNRLSATLFASGTLETRSPQIRLYPELFFRVPLSRHVLTLDYQYRQADESDTWMHVLKTVMQFNYSRHLALRLYDDSRNGLHETGAGIQLFW